MTVDAYLKLHAVAVAMSVVVAACAAPPASTPIAPSAMATSSVLATASPTAATRPVGYRVLSSVSGQATVSPDGRWLVALKEPTGRPQTAFPWQLFTIDGTFVRDVTISAYPTFAGAFGGWLPDSSGLFIATEAPQRAPPLAIVELDGRVITTELQLSHPTLSRDGSLIVAEQQEGCCVAIVQREIRVARRDGSGTRTLVSSAVTSEPQPVALLGIDAADRVVYRDGTRIMRVPLGGGEAATLATSPDYARLIYGSTSPDGLAIFTEAIRGGSRHIIANDGVTTWDDALGLVVEHSIAFPFKNGSAAMWVGPHAFLARDPSGSLFAVDALTSTRTPQGGTFAGGDLVLAHQRDTLLVVRGGVVVLIDLRTGAVRDTGLDLAPGGGSPSGAALPAGGFVLSSHMTTYRID